MIGASLLLAGTPAHALDPARGIGQLHHSAWTIADGAPPDIWALAQSSDGYLWLGTGAGLYRFDGVRFEKFRPLAGDRLPSANVNALFADVRGDLWIGFEAGQISRLRRGRLKTFTPGAPGVSVLQIAGDRNGGVWAALAGRQGGLAHFSDDRWTVVGANAGLPPGSVSSVLAAHDGAIWAATGGWLWVRRPGAPRFERTAEAISQRARIVQARDGRIWLSPGAPHPIHAIAEHLQPRGTGRAGIGPVPPAIEPSGEKILIDRDNVLWGARSKGGIFRIGSAKPSAHRDPVERFTLSEGLSSNIANPLLEDREGNIWIGTNLGLDRFREANAVAAPGLPPTSRQGFQIAAERDGAVYVLTGDTLFRAYADRPADAIARFDAIPRSLHVDRSGMVWAGFEHGIAQLDSARFQPVALPGGAKGGVAGWIELADGRLCASMPGQGVFCRHGATWSRAPAPLGTLSEAPVQMAADSKHRLWLNYEDHLLMIDGARQTRFARREGLDVGGVELIAAIGDDIYALGDFGLARFDGNRFRTLRSERHPLLSRLSGISRGVDGALWLNGIEGVVRIESAALAAAFADPARPLRATLLDLDDGLPGVAQQDANTPTALTTKDGRLWLVTSHGIAWIDPRRLMRNPLPPPVSITRLVAAGRAYPASAMIALPAGTRSLQIDYTALSLSIPERVRFRYQLETVDGGWVDPGQRRQAFYTGLGPGQYRFRVLAANNDGVWNRRGATLDFVIPPTFGQSMWFKIIIAGLLLAAGWLLYSLRMRQLASRIRGQLEERLRERERIARELHDTLLQGFQGLVYRFQSAIDRLPPSSAARTDLEQALDLADAALADGRDRVRDLRSGSDDDDLAQHFANTAAQSGSPGASAFRVITEGQPRTLHPVVRAEITGIGDEAILNAIRHARATKIEVNIVYHARELLLQIADNGIGISADMIAGGRRNHFGMTGMRERAAVIRADFSIASRPGGGTQVTLTVPASIAYGAERRPRKGLFRRWMPGED
nr:two-component regulator propeller domain-containing protein [Sphingomonas laterariae]